MDPAITVRAFFDKTSKSKQLAPIGSYTYELISSLLPTVVPSGSVAVDLGCHQGRYTQVLADRFHVVYGLDFATGPMRAMVRRRNIRLIATDLNVAPHEGWLKLSANFGLAVGLFEMLPNPERLCTTLTNWIVPGGQVLVVMPNSRGLHLRVLQTLFAVRRTVSGFRRPPLYHNGHDLSSIITLLESGGFDLVERGGCVGIPASLVSCLPARLQTFAIGFDRRRVRPARTSYEFGRFVRRS